MPEQLEPGAMEEQVLPEASLVKLKICGSGVAQGFEPVTVVPSVLVVVALVVVVLLVIVVV